MTSLRAASAESAWSWRGGTGKLKIVLPEYHQRDGETLANLPSLADFVHAQFPGKTGLCAVLAPEKDLSQLPHAQPLCRDSVVPPGHAFSILLCIAGKATGTALDRQAIDGAVFPWQSPPGLRPRGGCLVAGSSRGWGLRVARSAS